MSSSEIRVDTIKSRVGLGTVTINSSGLQLTGGDISVTGLNNDRGIGDKLGDFVSVKDYGAVGDGVTDDTTAIQNAINSLGSLGGVIHFPSGDYLITSVITVAKDRVSLVGNGIGTRIVCNNATSGAISVRTVGTYTFFFSIIDLQIAMTATSVTAGAALTLDRVTRCNIQNLYIDDGLVGVRLKGVTQTNIDNLQVLYEQDNGGLTNGRRFMVFEPDTDTNSHNGDVFITNFNGRCGSNFDVEFGVAIGACDGIWISNSHIGNCGTAHMAIVANFPVKTVGVLIDNVWFDQTTTGTYGVLISGTTSPTAGYYRFNNCTFLGSDSTSNTAIDIRGLAGNISINDCEIRGWGANGIYADNIGDDNRINNTNIVDCGLNSGNGIGIGTTNGWTVTNNKISGSNHDHHILLANSSTNVYVNNNIVDSPAVTGAINDITGTNISVQNNIGYNPTGYVNSLAVGASPWSYTNDTGYPQELFVYGGPAGIAGTITGVDYRGASFGNPMNDYRLTIHPGETTTITYTGALYGYLFGL